MAIAFSTKIINIIIFVYVVFYEQSLIQKYISMEKSIKGTMTEQNLLKAFAGESQARSRYTFFASVAKKEGFEQIAAVFSETADQELEHAKRFFKFLEGGMLEIQASYPAGKIGTLQKIYLLQQRERTKSGVCYTLNLQKLLKKRGSLKLLLLSK